MDELIDRMNKLLASSYGLYLKAHFFHWNTLGLDFPQYHKFFGKMYKEVYDSIDALAEQIRQLDGVPQNSPSMLKQNSYIKEQSSVPATREMAAALHADTQLLIKDVVEICRMADRFSELGLSNVLQDRHTALKKHAWMLKSTLTGSEE